MKKKSEKIRNKKFGKKIRKKNLEKKSEKNLKKNSGKKLGKNSEKNQGKNQENKIGKNSAKIREKIRKKLNLVHNLFELARISIHLRMESSLLNKIADFGIKLIIFEIYNLF